MPGAFFGVMPLPVRQRKARRRWPAPRGEHAGIDVRGVIWAFAAIGLVPASISLAPEAWAAEAGIPDRYHGVWEPVSPGQAPTCAANNADIRIGIGSERIELHEGLCVLQGIVPGSGDPLQLQIYCQQEDFEWVGVEQWSLGQSGGREQLTVTSLDPGNSYETVFGRCSGEAAGGQAGSAGDGGQTRSYCYREDMSELRLTTFGDRTAAFEIESAQGGAHMCGLSGTATSLDNGYRYIEDIDGLGRCELSILFDDNGAVGFEDPDWICKQHYCGARAAFEHIRFGDNARVDCG